MRVQSTFCLTCLVSLLTLGLLTPALTCYSQSPTWTQKLPTTSPPARNAHAMVYDGAGGEIVLFGGEGVNAFNRFADTWAWDGTNWTQKFPATSPSARALHAMAYDASRSQVVLFGGDDNAGPGSLSETWVWDGNNWTRKFPAVSPPGRRFHAMAYDAARGKVVLFGGVDAGGNTLGDTWVWNGTTWIQMSPANSPPARSAEAMAYDEARSQVVVLGGSRAPLPPLADTWVWDGNNWMQKTPTTSPSARAALGAMAYHSPSNRLVLFGGLALGTLTSFGPLADTWVWDGNNWTQGTPTTSPAKRSFHAISTDAARGEITLFGGLGSTSPNLGDTWISSFRVDGLHASVGNQSVTLYWNHPLIPVDSFNLEQIHGGIITPVPLPGTNTRRFVFPLENGQLYTFTITAVKNGIESPPSDFVLARPGEFAVSQPLPRPTNPILFLHGLGVDSSTWDDTKEFFTGTLNWNFGGELFDQQDQLAPQFRNEFFQIDGDFFTATFGDKFANYADGLGITHQSFEVSNFLQALKDRGSLNRKIIVAHSMGGLAARAFLAISPATSNRVSHLITYGTPHRGASWTFLNSFLEFAFRLHSVGADQMNFDCTNGQLFLSPFLNDLRSKVLPDISYTSIIGHSDSNYFEIFGVQLPLADHRIGGCFSEHWDGVVPVESANLQLANVVTRSPIQKITTSRTHQAQTSDFSAILCALDPGCFIAQVQSPVDIEVTAPDGRTMAHNLSAIPGASYIEIEEETGHETAAVLIPFPMGGDYKIKVIPKPGALPTDTYTLKVTHDGITTVLAQDQQIQNISPQPFTANTPLPVFVDIKPGGVPNPINLGSKGSIPVAILSTRVFDATTVDPTTVRFGGMNSQAHALRFSLQDVNKDGRIDMGLHFDTQTTGIACGDATASLSGKTSSGQELKGSDSIKTVGCR